MGTPTVRFHTLGCKLNQYDADYMKSLFSSRGWRVVEGPADVVVVNTCVVTGKAAAKCRQAIRSAVRSGAKVIVTGCYSQVAQEEIKCIPGVAALVGIRDRGEIVDIAQKALDGDGVIVKVRPHEPCEVYEDLEFPEPSLTRAYLKIQEGCDDYCTYCIVPYARGPSRSRPRTHVIAEAKELVARGYQEIVVTGTHIGLYGRDLGEPGALSEIIRDISMIQGVYRLRLSSLEPHDVDEPLLECLRLPQVCHHLHLPLQSGSDKILKLMGRRYDTAGFARIVEAARKIAPDIGLTTDVIVGFPGESEEDFEKTFNFVREMGFSRLHVFQYSARPGTPASNMPNKVPERVKAVRSQELISLGRELAGRFHRKYVGKAVEVLVEDHRGPDGLLQGVTRNYIHAKMEGPDSLMGKVAQAVVASSSDDMVVCQLT